MCCCAVYIIYLGMETRAMLGGSVLVFLLNNNTFHGMNIYLLIQVPGNVVKRPGPP